LVLAETFPTWKWPTYPRTYTTVPEGIEEELWDVATAPGLDIPISIDESLSDEGAARLAIHLTRERDSELVERKKHSVMNTTGTLGCEVCGFDFEARYGALGANFCEVHHLKPLAHRTVSEPTMLEELAVVCSNCHRMLHRRGLVSVIELKRQLL
jgi:5-methylcytosine-specific restriction protein A